MHSDLLPVLISTLAATWYAFRSFPSVAWLPHLAGLIARRGGDVCAPLASALPGPTGCPGLCAPRQGRGWSATPPRTLRWRPCDRHSTPGDVQCCTASWRLRD